MVRHTFCFFKDPFAYDETFSGWGALIKLLISYLICIWNIWINKSVSLSSKSSESSEEDFSQGNQQVQSHQKK